jgi:YHS domain-containing protein
MRRKEVPMTSLLPRRVLLGAATALLGTTGGAIAQSRTGGTINQMHAGQALKGYDAVSYFSGRPVVGREDISFEHGGGAYRFATQQNREAFKANPARYAPQYGGFCAWGIAQGKLFDIDPATGWEVSDGKLLLFFNPTILGLWKAERAALWARAEQNWPRLNV